MLPSPQLFGHTLSWYWLLISAAIIISLIAYGIIERRRPAGGYLYQKLSIIYGMIIAGFLFGRVFSLVEHYIGLGYAPSPKAFWGAFKTWEGSRWYGALVVGYFVLETARIVFRRASINWGQFFSNVATAVCLGMAIGKIGCFLDGHLGCGGTPTGLPWGVHYPYGTAASDVPLHPVQVYDSLAYFMLFLILLFYWRREHTDVYRILFVGVSFYNIPVELVIHNTVFLPGGLSFGQYVYIFLMLIATVPLLRKYCRTDYERLG